MKERPILFSAPMVRGILEDRKTKTRRIVKPQPAKAHLAFDRGYLFSMWSDAGEHTVRSCPYGVPGDVLWVKETWRTAAIYDDLRPTGLPPGARASWDANYTIEPNDGFRGKTRVSIHMPRRFSRISLRVTDVQVERLNEISDADVRAEGYPAGEGHIGPLAWYSGLWDAINGAGSWATNPWVWAVSFEVIR